MCYYHTANENIFIMLLILMNYVGSAWTHPTLYLLFIYQLCMHQCQKDPPPPTPKETPHSASSEQARSSYPGHMHVLLRYLEPCHVHFLISRCGRERPTWWTSRIPPPCQHEIARAAALVINASGIQQGVASLQLRNVELFSETSYCSMLRLNPLIL